MKRFTDTDIWDKDWYTELPPSFKCLVKYVFDKCDLAGFWKPNIKMASLIIGDSMSLEELLKIDEGRQFKMCDNKVFIPGFIPFQYGKLSMNSRVHKAVVDSLIKHNMSHVIEKYLHDEEDLPTAKRKRITPFKRDQIFAEDQYRCQYCGSHPEKYDLNIDHIVPVIKDGDNEDDNLITICVSCNTKKKDTNVFDFIEKHNITPLQNLSKKLDTLSKKLDTPKDKDKYKDKDDVLENNINMESEKSDFNRKPTASDFNGLPDVSIGSAKQLIYYTQKRNVSDDDIKGLWGVFKNEKLTGEKWYATRSDVYSHFINWIKTQRFFDIKSNPQKDVSGGFDSGVPKDFEY